MLAENVKWFHVELSSKCNAWCPMCPRNKNGFGLIDSLVPEDLDLVLFEDSLKKLKNLHAVQFCGNLGDPIASDNILDAIELSKKYKLKIQIHTNGSLRSKVWWSKLADRLRDVEHDIWFGIDGLKGVHEIYRQGTNYDKIIKNAEAFIQNGGHATWQFIPYAHNEHQLKDCMKLSKKIGFKKFILARLHRGTSIVRNYRTGAEYILESPKSTQHLVRMPKTSTKVDPKDCMHLEQPSVYLSANGKFSYCCYMANNIKFDTLDDLFYNNVDFNNSTCLTCCGS